MKKILGVNGGYWEAVRPTYLENLPSRVLGLSFASVQLPLSLDQAERLTKNNGEFGVENPPDISCIESLLERQIQTFPNGAFIRLGSRSPKDSLRGYMEGFRVHTAKEALSILLDSSERVNDDLYLALHHEYRPSIWLREFIDIPAWSEFRCFVQSGQLIGISQYDYKETYSQLQEGLQDIEWAIGHFFQEHLKRAMHLDSYIFDVFVTCRSHREGRIWEVKLVEVNPWFALTDPCLYRWVDRGGLNIEPKEPILVVE